MPINTAEVRKLFPATKRINYLFNGGTCLCCSPVQDAIRSFLAEIENGESGDNWQKWINDASEAYKLFAGLIGARTEEVVAIPNTSTGTGLIAHMINPKPGTKIVLDDLAFNTIYPFTTREKYGVGIRVARNVDGYMNIKELQSMVDDETSAIVVSSVTCWNGYRYSLKELSEIAHAHGAYLVVDAAQHAGAVRLDVEQEGVDFLATCGHKWLLAPPGSGFLYVRQDLIERFDPPLPGWVSVSPHLQDEVWQPEFPKTARRFETGMPSLMLLSAVKAGLQLIRKLGLRNIEDEILKRTSYLIEKLRDIGVKVYTPIEREHRAGLVTFLVRNHEALHKELLKNSIVTYHLPDTVVKNMHWPTGGLRVDPTFFNTMNELDDFLDFVRKHT